MPTCKSCGHEGEGNYCHHCGISYQTGRPKGGLSGCAVAGIVAAAVAITSVFILAVLAAIAVPNLLKAVERVRQKRAMDDIRVAAGAIEGYAARHGIYPTAESMDDLAEQLEPTYARALPRQDPWHNPFRYESWRVEMENGEAGGIFGLGSAGRDGEWERPTLSAYTEGRIQTFDGDIVYRGGSFIRYP